LSPELEGEELEIARRRRRAWSGAGPRARLAHCSAGLAGALTVSPRGIEAVRVWCELSTRSVHLHLDRGDEGLAREVLCPRCVRACGDSPSRLSLPTLSLSGWLRADAGARVNKCAHRRRRQHRACSCSASSFTAQVQQRAVAPVHRRHTTPTHRLSACPLVPLVRRANEPLPFACPPVKGSASGWLVL
jgi:hypothetical protein